MQNLQIRLFVLARSREACAQWREGYERNSHTLSHLLPSLSHFGACVRARRRTILTSVCLLQNLFIFNQFRCVNISSLTSEQALAMNS